MLLSYYYHNPLSQKNLKFIYKVNNSILNKIPKMAELKTVPILDSVINFVTLNGVNLYGVYKPECTTLGNVMKTFYDNYDLKTYFEVELFSEKLGRLINELDFESKMINLNLGNISKFIVKPVVSLEPNGLSADEILEKYDKMLFKLKDSDMQIFCKTLTGKTLTIAVEPDLTILDLKGLLCRLQNYPISENRLIHDGRHLEDNKTLKDYGIVRENTIHSVLRLRGGMFHETSGRNGDYKPLESSLFFIEPDISMND